MHLHSSEAQHMSEQNHSPQASTQDSYESVENPQALDKGSPPSVEGGDRDRNREREETVKNSPIISEDTESCNSVAYNEDSNDYSKVIIFQDREAGSYARASELSCAAQLTEAPADDAALETESCDLSVGRDTQESICESRLSTPAVVAEGEMVSQEETAAMSVATTQEADITETTADRTETTADITEATADMTETAADVTETTADITITSEVIELTADRSEITADITEATADITETTADRSETTADITETTADRTETTADVTEITADITITSEVIETTADITEATADRRDTLGINSQDTDGEVDYGDTTLNLSVECAESFPAVFRVSS